MYWVFFELKRITRHFQNYCTVDQVYSKIRTFLIAHCQNKMLGVLEHTEVWLRSKNPANMKNIFKNKNKRFKNIVYRISRCNPYIKTDLAILATKLEFLNGPLQLFFKSTARLTKLVPKIGQSTKILLNLYLVAVVLCFRE